MPLDSESVQGPQGPGPEGSRAGDMLQLVRRQIMSNRPEGTHVLKSWKVSAASFGWAFFARRVHNRLYSPGKH